MLWMPKGKCPTYEDDDTRTVRDKPQYEYFTCDVPFSPKNNHRKWVVSATSSSRRGNLGAEGLSNCPDVVESRCQAIALCPCPLSPTFPLHAGTMASARRGDSRVSIWVLHFIGTEKSLVSVFLSLLSLKALRPQLSGPGTLSLCFHSQLQFCSASCH